MPIDPKKVNSDVTLALEDKSIAALDFRSAVEHFFGLVKEVTGTAAPGRDPNQWYIELYRGSAGLGLRALPGAYTKEQVHRISSAVVKGLQDLKASRRPRLFNDSAIEHSKVLAGMVSRKNDNLMLRVFGRNGAGEVTLSRSIARGAVNILAPVYEQEGSVDGILETISSRQQNEVVVYDALNDMGIRCFINATMVQEALPAFNKRVEVFGLVQYRDDGQPVSVKARSIVPFPADEEIPSVDEMRQLLKGA